MSRNDERLVNRTVLKFFNDLRGIPQAFEEVSEMLESRLRKPCEGETERALEYLASAGYLMRCELTAVDPRLWKISAKGMRQAERQVPETELDRMIWG